MMDRNREARRAAAMANGLPRRRHRTTTSGSLRDSPEDDGPMELQEPARLRDRPVKKDREQRDRDMRDRDRDRDRDMRDRERERDRLIRNKRRRGDKFLHREDGVAGDDSSEESVNDEDEEDDEGPGPAPVRYVPPPSTSTNHHTIPMTSASSLTHRKSYPPPTKVFRQAVAPTWKAPDEMMGVCIPRKARTASTKRNQDSWGAGGVVVSGDHHIHRQASASPVRSTMTGMGPTTTTPQAPSPSPGNPMSPSSSTISIKKKIKPNGGPKQKPPKSCLKSSSSSSPPNPVQDDIEIEVAEVLYGLKRQSQAQETTDSKSRVSSPISAPPQNSSSSTPLTTVAPKRKRPRPYPDENPNPAVFPPRTRPISPTPKAEDQTLSTEKSLVGSAMENGDLGNKSNDLTVVSALPVAANGVTTEAKPPLVANGVITAEAKMLEESRGRDGVVVRAKVEEASSSSPPKMESQEQTRVESTSTSTKPSSCVVEKESSRREDKFEIDLMAPASPEREGEYGGAMMEDEKLMVTDGQAEAKPNEEVVVDEKKGVKLNAAAAAETTEAPASEPKSKLPKAATKPDTQCEPHKQPPAPCEQQHNQLNNLSCKDRSSIDLHLDLDNKAGSTTRSNVANDHKLDLHHHKQQPPKLTKDEPLADKNGQGQSSSVPLPMSVAAGWHGGLGPMGYVAPLQGVVSMDGTTMPSPPIQTPPFVFVPPKPKRCATHCYIARSIKAHGDIMKMNPYWPAPGAAPLFGAKPYNLNMVPPPPDLHAAAAAGGRGGVVPNSVQDKAQPFALFPAQPSSKDKSPLSSNAPDGNAQKKQFLLPQSLPPGAPPNMMTAPAFFFPFGQQQAAAAAAAVASVRPGSTKSPSTGGSTASTTTTSTSAPMGGSAAGPAMSFSYPNMGGNETQFMAILGNGPYPFPVPAHVGAAPPYRGSHPQAMSFFNGSFYSSQMLHPSQMQQQQQQSAAPQSIQIQQQNHQNPSISTASSSSQKHLQQQSQQQRPQGGAAPAAGAGGANPSWQNFPAAKGRPQHDAGGEDSPSTADSRTRPNMSVYGQNFTMPFHPTNFALMTTPPSSAPGSGNNNAAAGGEKKQQQQQTPQQQGLKAGIESLTPAFPMSFASINGATTPGLDISSMAHHNHAILQSLPEGARQSYQMMAAAAQAAQAAHQKKNSYRGPEDGKSGGGNGPDGSNVEEERKAMASRAASVGGQSIAFSRDLSENSISTVPGGNVVDSSARSLNLMSSGSARPARSSGPNAGTNASNAANSQQQQSQILFSKQQQYVAATVAAARSKNPPPTSNGSVYPDHLTSSVMAGKFPNALASFPTLVQSGGTPVQSPQWKTSVRPNTSQVSSPSLAGVATSAAAPNNKSHPQQQLQGRPQQNHTQISFAAAAANPKPPSSQGSAQQSQNNNQAPSPPMMVGSPSTSSISKGAGGSPRTTTGTSASSKTGAQSSSLSAQQGRNSPSPSLSSQKPSILGSPHIIQSSTAGGKHDSQQQPQLSKQSLQQAQMFFSSAYMQPSTNPSPAGGGYYLQRHRPENQQQQQGSKSQGGSGAPVSSSGMLSLGAPVSMTNSGTSDPAKAVANSMKGLPAQGLFHAAQFAQSAGGGTHQLVPAGFPYVHAVPTAVQVKPAEQKQPAGE